MNAPRPRTVIDALPRYVPGARGSAAGPAPIKLSSNEVPLDPASVVREAIDDAAAHANRYPDMFAVELTQRIAEAMAVTPAQVAVGGGSVAVLQHVIQAYCDAGDQVVYAWRSFEAYPIIVTVSGAIPVQVPLDDRARHNLDAMAAAITERTTVVILCSPNNPTGTAIGRAEFEQFMDRVPTRVLVVLDEAYAEFVRGDDAVAGLDVLPHYPNLVVVRTFSKAYGLAALRVGYAMGSEQLIAPIRACVTPFSVSGVAQAAALAALASRAALLERLEAVVEQREEVVPQVRAQGWEVPEARGNFYWLACGQQALDVATYLAELPTPILVRPFAGDGVRISVGTAQENAELLRALAQWRTDV